MTSSVRESWSSQLNGSSRGNVHLIRSLQWRLGSLDNVLKSKLRQQRPTSCLGRRQARLHLQADELLSPRAAQHRREQGSPQLDDLIVTFSRRESNISAVQDYLKRTTSHVTRWLKQPLHSRLLVRVDPTSLFSFTPTLLT